jgi:rSAM/selenodomain-associated transferase 2
VKGPACPFKKISVIIPVLNEEPALRAHLPRLQYLRDHGHELIVVDGGSTDWSRGTAQPLVDHLLVTPPSRGLQMNIGAAAATGELLLFLHIDTRLPEHADDILAGALAQSGSAWGRFDIELSGNHPAFRVIERMINLRSRLSGIATGDQALFVMADVFREIGGYPDIPLMEDLALCRMLRKSSRPLALKTRVISSSRRWEKHGIFRTVLLMWALRFGFFVGIHPERLHRQYYKKPS